MLLHFCFNVLCVCVFVFDFGCLETVSELTRGKNHSAIQESCDIKVIMAADQFIWIPLSHQLITDQCRSVLRFEFCLIKTQEGQDQNKHTEDRSEHYIQANNVYRGRLMVQREEVYRVYFCENVSFILVISPWKHITWSAYYPSLWDALKANCREHICVKQWHFTLNSKLFLLTVLVSFSHIYYYYLLLIYTVKW